MDINKKELLEALKNKEQEDKEIMEKEEQVNKIIVELLPAALQHINDVFTELCEEPLACDEKDERAEFFKHFDKKIVGEAAIKTLKIMLRDQSLLFELDRGVGYVGATAKVKIVPNNIHLPKEKAPYIENGIYIGINTKEKSFEIYWIIDNKKVAFNEKNALRLLYDIFVGKKDD